MCVHVHTSEVVHVKLVTPHSNSLLTVPMRITEISQYLLGNFRKFILNIVFELSSKYLQKVIYLS